MFNLVPRVNCINDPHNFASLDQRRLRTLKVNIHVHINCVMLAIEEGENDVKPNHQLNAISRINPCKPHLVRYIRNITSLLKF